MLKLHRLKITRFRSVKPCELVFHDGLNVLLGKNGSGKTTLLQLLASLSSARIRDIVPGEEFELEVEFHFEIGAVITGLKRILVAQTEASEFPSGGYDGVSYELNLRIALGEFQVQVRKAAQGQSFLVTHDTGTYEVPWGTPFRELSLQGLFRVFLKDAGDLRNRVDEELSGYAPPFRLDESLEALELIRRKRIDLQGPYGAAGRDFFIYLPDPWPQGYREHFHRVLTESPDSERVFVTERELEFLQRFVDLTGLRSARMISERIEKKVLRQKPALMGCTFSNFHFSFTRRDGSEFPQEQLSYGQKRLLTFLYCQSAIPQVMIADELVNGLHHDWIESCVELLRDRQSFLSSQNPLLLDHLYFESSDEIRKTFILCSAEQEEDRDVLTWKNMSPEEAEVVHRAYQTGVQHVSEILHSQGLW